MNLRHKLREQARRSLSYAGTGRSSAAVLAWWKTDDTANELCGKISPVFQNLYRSCPIDTVSDLLTCLSELQDSGDSAELLPVYLLWVGGRTPPPDLGKILRRFQNNRRILTADVCCISAAADSFTEGYRYDWCLDPESASAADTLAVLLLVSSTIGIPLDPRMAVRRFRVRSILHNSIERDLARQLAACLNGLLEGDKIHWREDFLNTFDPGKNDIKSLYDCLPCPEDLPIPGEHDLADCLLSNNTGWYAALLRRLKDRENRYRDISIREALEIFFGKVGHASICEYLRMELPKHLDALCKNRQISLGMERRCYQRSLGLLREGASLAANCLEEVRSKQAAVQERCDRILCQKFAPRNTKLSELLEGMDDYLQIWQEYTYCALEIAWWQEIGQIFAEDSHLMREVNKQYRILSQGIQIINDMGISVQNGKDTEWSAIDWRGKTPETLLSGLYSKAEFSMEEIVRLIRNAHEDAEQRAHGSQYRETFIFYPGDLSALEAQEDVRRYLVLHRDGKSLTSHGTTSKLRIISLPQIGKQSLWELHIDAYQ